MNIEQSVFYFLAFIVIASAILVVATGNLVRALFLFFVTLFSLAGLYVFSLADFVAVTQVVIYVGGVLVLMLFAFLLSNKEMLNNLRLIKSSFIGLQQLPGILVAGLFFFLLVSLVLEVKPDSLGWIGATPAGNKIEAGDNTTQQIGILMMTRYLLPFEVISVLLMMALIGAAHLARKEKRV